MNKGSGGAGGEGRGIWKGYYGEEPFDLRLAVLRLFCRLPFLAGAVLLGTLLLGGGYYVKNVLLREENPYAVTSVFRVEYHVEEEKDVGTVFINEASWNTYIHSEMFLEWMEACLKEQGGPETGAQVLQEMLRANLATDLRLPSVTVTGPSPEECVAVAQAVETVMTGELARQIREIASVMVVDPGDQALEVVPDVRVGRAVALGAVLSCFAVLTAVLLKEAGDDSIWLPSSLGRRYGLNCVGTLESRELWENLRYHFGCPGQEDSFWERRMGWTLPEYWKGCGGPGDRRGSAAGRLCPPPRAVPRSAGSFGRRRAFCWLWGRDVPAAGRWSLCFRSWSSRTAR